MAIAIDQVRYKALKLAAAKSELQLQHHAMYNMALLAGTSGKTLPSTR